MSVPLSYGCWSYVTKTLSIGPIAWCLKTSQYEAAAAITFVQFIINHCVETSRKQDEDDVFIEDLANTLCDKLYFHSTIWGLLYLSDLTRLSYAECVIFVLPCLYCVYGELILCILKIYHRASCFADKLDESIPKFVQSNISPSSRNPKDIFQAIGLALLCIAQSHSVPVLLNWVGILGLILVACSGILVQEEARHLKRILEGNIVLPPAQEPASNNNVDIIPVVKSGPQTETKLSPSSVVKIVNGNTVVSAPKKKKYKRRFNVRTSKALESIRNETLESLGLVSRKELWEDDEGIGKSKGTDSSEEDEEVVAERMRNKLFPATIAVSISARVDKVYTIGCFDLFHEGHLILFQRLRALGKQVVVGVHDNKSIFRLKNRLPVDSTEKRMSQVKNFVDLVYSIPSKNPSTYLECAINLNKSENGLYVRGDDMPNFPGRSVVEKYMDILFLPYTQGVSSTKLRTEFFSAYKVDDGAVSE